MGTNKYLYQYDLMYTCSCPGNYLISEIYNDIAATYFYFVSIYVLNRLISLIIIFIYIHCLRLTTMIPVGKH